jgi:60 kDa SS-A/Ro ribonucleoprotein
MLPPADSVNSEGAPAYRFSARNALAQYAATGCFSRTFYATAEEQLAKVVELTGETTPEFIARTALFCRREGRMKDMPALLCAVLSVRGPGLLAEIFDRVINTPRMLRNFVQIMRSGAVGRRSLGSLPKRLVENWLAARDDEILFAASIGTNPSMADIIRMVHPRPATASRNALLAYLIGRPHREADLPEMVRQFERFKRDPAAPMPDVPFQKLAGLPLTREHWRVLALRGTWQMVRMNLNTFARHGVFDSQEAAAAVAARLADKETIDRVRPFPYQLLATWSNLAPGIPAQVRAAVQDAVEMSLGSVPRLPGKIYICVDVSRSMHSPVTGSAGGVSSKMRCIDVAAFFAAAIVRKNPDAEVLAFSEDARRVAIHPRDSVTTNAALLASLPAGGTNCSAALGELNRAQARGDMVIFVSDYESWLDAPASGRPTSGRTEMMAQWARFRSRNADGKLVAIDLQPNCTTQVAERPDVLNIGGFSDAVFDLLALYAEGRLHGDHWIGVIESQRI